MYNVRVRISDHLSRDDQRRGLAQIRGVKQDYVDDLIELADTLEAEQYFDTACKVRKYIQTILSQRAASKNSAKKLAEKRYVEWQKLRVKFFRDLIKFHFNELKKYKSDAATNCGKVYQKLPQEIKNKYQVNRFIKISKSDALRIIGRAILAANRLNARRQNAH